MRRPPFTATNSRRGTRERGVPRLRKCFVFYIRFCRHGRIKKKRKKERKKNVMAAKDGGEGTIRKVGRCARAFYLAERRSPQSRVLVLRDRSPTLGHYKFSVAIESSPR